MKVLIQGDVHTINMRLAYERGLLPKEHTYEFTTLPGATTHPLDNPNGRRNTIKHFKGELSSIKPEVLITHVGETDCSFSIWYRHEKYGITIEDQVIESIKGYFDYLKDAEQIVDNIIVTSVTPPTLPQGVTHPALKLRNEVMSPVSNRMALTAIYCEILYGHCVERGYTYVAANQSIVKHGSVLPEFLGTDPSSALLSDNVVPVWGKHLTTAINNIG